MTQFSRTRLLLGPEAMERLYHSHVLLFGTALAIVWLAARIYRRGILHYGQKASFKDLFKWIK